MFYSIFFSISKLQAQPYRNCTFMQQFKGRVPGVKVKAVDTTGAGDAFVAGFLYCFASDMNLFQVTLSSEN